MAKRRNRNQLAKIKEEFIDSKQTELSRKITRFERALYNRVFDDFLASLDVSQGSINTTTQNINLTASLDKIFAELQPEYNKIITSFGNDLVNIGKFNAGYFESVSPKTLDVADKVNRSITKIIGVKSDGSLIKDGFLDRFAKDTSLFGDIKDTVYKSVSSGKSFVDLKTDLGNFIQGNEELEGGFQKYFRNYAYDAYQQTDRKYQELYSKELELTAFIYEGGVIETSRPFCEYCNGKVFLKEEFQNLTRSDVAAFIKYSGPKNPTSGIPSSGWDPLIDMGGFGCRHSKNYISDFLAIDLRSDLKIVNGKLVKG